MSLQRSGRLRAFSARRASAQRKRVKVLRETLHGPQRCQWPSGCASEASDAHELLSRARGGSIDPASGNVVLLCRTHHDWVTTHPIESAALGLSQRRCACADDALTVSVMAKRNPITLRVSDDARGWVDTRASKHKASQAVVLRAMLSVATGHPSEVDDRVKAIIEAEQT